MATLELSKTCNQKASKNVKRKNEVFHQLVELRAQSVDTDALDLSEILCNRCGICCYAKQWLPDMRVKFLVKEPTCPHLSNTHSCEIYLTRFETANCASIEHALLGCILPKNCVYVKKNWQQIQHWYLLPDESELCD